MNNKAENDWIRGIENEKNDTSLPAIGNRISIMRQKIGLTQQELADALNVRRENVSYWENGTRDLKSETIVLLAQKLNTTCDYLLGLSDVPSVDVDLKAVCDYTGLSEESVQLIKSNPKIDFETLKTFIEIREFLDKMIKIIKKN